MATPIAVYAAPVHPENTTTDPVSWRRLVAATVLWILSTAGPVIWLRTRWGLSGDLAEDPVYIVFFVAVGLLCALALLLDRPRTTAALVDADRRRNLRLAMALATILTLSAAWSLEPGVTFTHGLRFIGTIAIALYIATRLTALQQTVTLWVAVQFGSAWSFVQIYRLAEGSQDDDEHWVGIFVNRNLLGLVTGVGIALSVLLAAHVATCESGRRRVVLLAVLGLAALVDLRLLWGSRSATPIGVLALSAVVVALVLVLRRVVPVASVHKVSAGLAYLVTALVVTSALLLPAIAGAFGRGGNLSRRTPLWDFVRDKIGDRPLQGWGYLGGWEDKGFLRDMKEFVRGKDLVSAHNSTLEVMLGAGIVAASIFVVLVALTTRSALRTAMRRSGGAMALWPLVGLMWFLFESLTETFLVADTLPTVLFLTVAFHGAVASGNEPPRDLATVDGGETFESASVVQQTD